MVETIQKLNIAIVLAPLIGSIIAGLFGSKIGRTWSHRAAIAGVAIACALSAFVFNFVVSQDGGVINQSVYTWGVSDEVRFEVGFMIDHLSAMMMVVVTFVSLMVHIYTIGYMQEDPGYTRFFSYISLFTFSMLMLVMSNNFMQLFFGWEAVGLVSYLLIGFWYTRESAIYANLKAFLVNRVGDFGFVLGIAAVLMYFNTLDYAGVFAAAELNKDLAIEIIPGVPWSVMTVICILLFVGAMGKSAQWPLHVWLPDSMEGPTPISALIHAATMVTAGIFMVARMSPLYELSETALTVVMIIGAITALFMGFLGLVQNDVKRVVAYSTLSQLGYMTVALGASAYAAGVFHLMTHAFFKALLFLGAGSVIIAMHHEQDMRKMGGLRKYMPWTWITALIGSLALIGFPGFAGFYSKDIIIEAVGASTLWGHTTVYYALLAGVFVTALYSFRMYFLVFHGKERFDTSGRHGHEPAAAHGHGHDSHGHGAPQHDDHGHGHHGGLPKESPWVVVVPLIMLAIPSVVIGAMYVGDMPYGHFFDDAIFVHPEHNVLGGLAEEEFHGWFSMMLHGFMGLPFLLAMAGVGTAWFLYLKRPEWPERIANRFRLVYRVLERKYGFDEFNDWFFARGSRGVGNRLWRFGDVTLIDGMMVNGSARVVGWSAAAVRWLQSGYLYHYAFAMILGLLLLFGLFVLG